MWLRPEERLVLTAARRDLKMRWYGSVFEEVKLLDRARRSLEGSADNLASKIAPALVIRFPSRDEPRWLPRVAEALREPHLLVASTPMVHIPITTAVACPHPHVMCATPRHLVLR